MNERLCAARQTAAPLCEQPSLSRQENSFISILGSELVVDLAQMPLHCICGKGQLLGDSQVGVTLRQAPRICSSR